MGNCQENQKYINIDDKVLHKVAKYVNLNDKYHKISTTAFQINNKQIHRHFLQLKQKCPGEYFCLQNEENQILIKSLNSYKGEDETVQPKHMPFAEEINLSGILPKQVFKVGNKSFLTTYQQGSSIYCSDRNNSRDYSEDFATVFNQKLGYYKRIVLDSQSEKIHSESTNISGFVVPTKHDEENDHKSVPYKIAPFTFTGINKIQYSYSRFTGQIVYFSLHDNSAIYVWTIKEETPTKITIQILFNLTNDVLSDIKQQKSSSSNTIPLDVINNFDLCYDVNSHLEFHHMKNGKVLAEDLRSKELAPEEEIFMIGTFPQLSVGFIKFSNPNSNSNDSNNDFKPSKYQCTIGETKVRIDLVSSQLVKLEKSVYGLEDRHFKKGDEFGIKDEDLKFSDKEEFVSSHSEQEMDPQSFVKLYSGPVCYYNTFNKVYQMLLYTENKIACVSMTLSHIVDKDAYSVKIEQSWKVFNFLTDSMILSVLKYNYKYLVAVIAPSFSTNKLVLILNLKLDEVKVVELVERESSSDDEQAIRDKHILSNKNLNKLKPYLAVKNLLKEMVVLDHEYLLLFSFSCSGKNPADYPFGHFAGNNTRVDGVYTLNIRRLMFAHHDSDLDRELFYWDPVKLKKVRMYFNRVCRFNAEKEFCSFGVLSNSKKLGGDQRYDFMKCITITKNSNK
mmetsp:Transcript_24190/g.25236  ORF Transcript_24190/g.25236 Transcript_24190/m.25236 type:complete len:674 (+) Transcript_24190:14-2035(+)